MMFRKVAIAALVVVGASVQAQNFSYDFESLSTGDIIGQDGWAYTEAGTATSRVDDAIFSPMGGSTKSLRMEDGTTSTRIARPMGVTMTSGLYHVGYDMRHSPRITGNLVMSTLYYQAGGTTQIFQPYAQNGGGAGAAQNAFTDTDGLGGAGYAGTGWIATTIVPDVWHRVEFDMDFTNHTIGNGTLYDISSGTKVLIGSSPTTFFFNNTGSAWYDQWDRLGVRLGGQLSTGEGWNMDNFSAEFVPEPASLSVLAFGALAFLKRRRR